MPLTGTVRGMVYPDNEDNQNNDYAECLRNLNVKLNGSATVVNTSADGLPGLCAQYEFTSTDAVSIGLESTFAGGRDFVVQDGSSQPWMENQPGDFTFPRDMSGGFRPNVYYWADRTFTWFKENLQTDININQVSGVRGQTKIGTNRVFQDPKIQCATGSNLRIECKAGGQYLAPSILADVLLHEFSHAAVYAKRGNFVDASTVDGPAVDEGVASYLACRINDDVSFFSGIGSSGTFDIDPFGAEKIPVDENGDNVVDPADWTHYDTGPAIASTLWDLTKSIVTDPVLWDSLKTPTLNGYSPENLYKSIHLTAIDPPYSVSPTSIGSHLWDTFSAHGMNLWAKPNGAGGVAIDWFDHWSPSYAGYYVYRNTTSSFSDSSSPILESGLPKLFATGTTAWTDVTATSSSTTYYYAVRAVSADGQVKSGFSNVSSSKGEPTGGNNPAPPTSFTGQVTVVGGYPCVLLQWTKSGSPNMSRYLIQRAQNSGFTGDVREIPVSESAPPSHQDFEDGFLADQPYYYRIRAESQSGLPSPWVTMTPAFVVPRTTNPPAKPTDLKGRGDNGGAKFTWTAPEKNADGSDLTDLAGYRLYYSTGVDPTVGSMVQLAASAESKELTGLANNTPYFVCVTAFDLVGNESECSDVVTVTPSAARWVHASGGPNGSYTSISAALFGAPYGTRIIVGPGVYEEASIIVGADDSSGWNPLDIWLVSERGPAETKIITGKIEVGDKCRVIGFTVAETPGRAINIHFDKGVLLANNIFLGNGTAISSGGMGGWPRTGETANRIYNNVFAGNVTGIDLHFNYNLTDIQNNLFEGTDQDHVGIMFNGCGDTYIRHNNFNGSGSSISDEHPCALIGSNSTCAPQFEDFNAFNLLASDFHLEPGDSCAEDTGATNVRFENEPWEDCTEFGDNGYQADLGAYGGPFACIDKNLNGIPDCSEPKGWSSGVAVLKNSTNQPVTLAARNMDTEGMSFSVAEATAHGDLAGAAPHLSYTVTPEYVGPDSLSFTVANTLGESAPEQVSITVKEAHRVCVTRA